MNKITLEISESDLNEVTREAAIAEGKDPLAMFKEHLKTVSKWSSDVESGDSEGAVVYSVSEIIRTVDNVDGGSTLQTDSASTLERTENGRFDLRNKTK